jgi:hypothetical protein
VAAFADSKLETLFHSDGVDQLDLDLGVVARHDHVLAFGELDRTGDVGRAEVELRAVTGEERAMATTLLFREAVDLTTELGVRCDGARFCKNLSALDFFLVDTAKKGTDVVAGLAFIQQLVEHFDTGNDGLLGRADADDFNRIVHMDNATLDTAGYDGASAGNREHVLDRHQERLVDCALRIREEAVHCIEQLLNGLGGFGVVRLGHRLKG